MKPVIQAPWCSQRAQYGSRRWLAGLRLAGTCARPEWRHACRRVALAVVFMLAACRQPGAGTPELIQIDGSSTVFPIIEAMAEEFQIAEQGAVQMTVGISGSGGGFKKFCRGELDIANASRPIELSEIEQCRRNGVRFVELPIAYDAITLVVHPQNNWVDQLTVAELRRIWQPAAQGEILRWRQVRSAFPDVPLNLYGAGSDSGTFDYFTAAVNGRERASRGDYTASEDDNLLVRGVANDRYALGYFGLAYYGENQDKLRPVAIVNEHGVPVLPSLSTVQRGEYTPLSRPVFMYANAAALERPAVARFLRFFFAPHNRRDIIHWVGYVPLPADAYAWVVALVEQRRTGSRFRATDGSTRTLDQAMAVADALPGAGGSAPVARLAAAGG